MAMIGSIGGVRVLAALTLTCALLMHGRVPADAATSELDVLNGIPRGVLDRMEFDAEPDPHGAMQLNVGGWRAVVYQRIAIPLVWTGAVEGNSSKIDDGWRAIDLAFAHQLEDGSFETVDGKPMPPSEMSFWLEAVCHALLVVQDSSLAARYAPKIAALKPKIGNAVAWLERPAVRKNLLLGDFYNGAFFSSNRLFVDATAFLTASQLLGDPKPRIYARQFLAQVLARETPAGVFPEEGGYDSSYQGVSLLHATYFLLRDPSAPGLRIGIAKALRREVRSVDATGDLIVGGNTLTAGRESPNGAKTPDLRSVILGLYYSGVYLHDVAGTQAGGRAFKKTFHINPSG